MMGDTTADDQARECPGCEEIFDDDDNKIQKLVCGHEICGWCVFLQTEDRNYVICAVCNKKHSIAEEFGDEVTNGQNAPELCAAHSRESALYCKRCDESICLQCLILEHNGHDLVDLVEHDRVKLKDSVDGLNSELDQWQKMLLKARADLNVKTKLSKDGLVSKRNELVSIVAKIDTFMQQEARRFTSEQAEINKKFLFIAAQKVNAKNLIETIEKESGKSRINAIASNVQQLKQDIESKLKESAAYKYYEYRYSEASEEETEKLCGKLLERAQILSIEPNEKEITLECAGQILSGYSKPRLVGNGTIFTNASLKEGGKSKDCCIKCDTNGDNVRIVEYVNLGFGDMIELEVEGKSCIAVSDWYSKITIRDISSLKEVSAIPIDCCTYASSGSTLLIVDQSRTKKMAEVKWFDCSKIPPKPAKGKREIRLKVKSVQHVCYINEGNTELIVIITSTGILQGYATSGKLLWKNKGDMIKGLWPYIVPGDECLFVFCTDEGSDIYMFSFTGQFLGFVPKQGIGHTRDVRWIKETGSLKVLHVKEKKVYISNVKIHLNEE